jgi:murein L,D-transpeptidase YafK
MVVACWRSESMPRRAQRKWWLLAGALLTASVAIAMLGPRSMLSMIGMADAQGRAESAARRVAPRLRTELQTDGFRWGAPLLIRIFKLDDQLEVWMATDDGYRLFRTYPICTWSGALGPKQQQGDGQSPEGFYRVARGQMNPASRYHLSFNLGYPNAYDRFHGRTGDYLMVHGSCVSIGCYAMGDDAIEEIYTLMSAAFDAGQLQVPVHAFPFRFDRDDAGARLADATWGSFWTELQPAWTLFEQTRLPPRIDVVDGHYRVGAAPR